MRVGCGSAHASGSSQATIFCKAYVTSANMGYYTGARDKLQKVVLPLAASSPRAAAEAATAIQAWLKDGPVEEKKTVIAYQYKLNGNDISKRLAELTGKKP